MEAIDLPEFSADPGTLYVVPTPIGNLGDLSSRIIDILKSCSLIACEDTRVTGKLLKILSINTPTVSYRDQNEKAQALACVEKLKNGSSVALVCDAGTPTLSDPGFRLVRECRRELIPVVPLPGPTALITALSASGLPTNGFLYAGFLAPKRSARLSFFQKYEQFEYTLAIYESCHRIAKMMEDAESVFGPERIICVARELTKLHETFLVGTISSVKPQLIGKNQKGEFVVLIAPQKFEL